LQRQHAKHRNAQFLSSNRRTPLRRTELNFSQPVHLIY
jgi:hypothetical protein